MNKRRKIEEDEKDDKKRKFIAVFAVLLSIAESSKKIHSPAIFRKRWDSDYLINLAIQEKSFITEYRLNLTFFNLLYKIFTSIKLVFINTSILKE